MTILGRAGKAALIAAVLLGGSALPAAAGAIADFYTARTIRIVLGAGPGSGYAAYARTLARHMGTHVPGHPDIVVKGMDGAASIVAANYVYNVAPRDGTVIGAIQRNAPMVQILGQSGPEFRSDRFNWLGSLENDVGVIVVLKRSGIENLDDAFQKPVVLGSTGTSESEAYPALMNNTLGTKFQIVRGYSSPIPVHLAMDRGELAGLEQSWSSFKGRAHKLLANGAVNVLVQLSTARLPELTEMGVPLIFDDIDKEHVLPGYSISEVEDYFRLMLTSRAMARPYVLGPGVPPERVEALRAAFIETADDPDFIADARRQKLDVSLVKGRDLQEMIARMAAAPEKVKEKLTGLIRYQGKVKTVAVEMQHAVGRVTAVRDAGRTIVLEARDATVSAGVSPSRTDVTIDGRQAGHGVIEPGMTCHVTYPAPGMEATEVDCKG